MSENEMKALMLLAGFQVMSHHALENQYWPKAPDYAELRMNSPWWLVNTNYGQIVMGRRKRVFSIEWNAIGLVHPDLITSEDVTKWKFGVHAWSLPDALRYLIELRRRLPLEAVPTEAAP